MTSQALTTAGAKLPDLTISDIRKYICPAATEQEAFMFLRLCQAQGLNPFTRDAYLIKYNSNQPATMVIGKDGFTRRAEEHPKFAGFRAGIITDSEQHGIMEREGAFFTALETLVGGWAEVHRNDRSVPFRATVRIEEYNTRQGQWNKMPATMIRKVALVQALREAFPSSFAGLYDAAEMGVDGEALPTNVIDVTASEAPAPAPRQQPRPQQQPQARVVDVTPQPVEEPYAPAAVGITRAQDERIRAMVQALGWSPDTATDYITKKYGVDRPSRLTRDQAFDFQDYLTMLVARAQSGTPDAAPQMALDAEPAPSGPSAGARALAEA